MSFDCCALCSMFSCDCGPKDPCKQYKATPAKDYSMVGVSIKIPKEELHYTGFDAVKEISKTLLEARSFLIFQILNEMEN